ncbi:tripartite tricarboxylate transporter substrate binding protein [Roseomonas xinghualingensis]|uniref:tripartite tricarboxylate transporter substrate binding protein n=1 Tax=Roseomonas xinghualingensis TaxID=2986475 RepID=UPI0021F1212D|nr:tripartite tricarboxylate transporter substrate binding protein [Roseomonas sp. SXEYE001]MCV4205926.1 tripartite tricarboxylate transporter substrate binding protein [Roseomonas sp. SXEYE001]
MRNLPRRRLLALAAALPALGAIPASARPAWAQSQSQAAWPDKPVRMIVPVAPGGSLDILGRTAARALTAPLGQSVVVENHTGAGSNIAFDLVARAKPDGLTLLVGSDPLTINPSLYSRIGFDPVRDFAAIAELVRAPQVLVVKNGLEARSLAEYRRLAQELGGSLTLASQGNGSIGHLGGILLGQTLGFNTTHVPYRGGGPAVVDLVAGHIDSLLVTLPAAIEHIREGRIRALAVTGLKRSPALPEVPTVAESGFPGFEVVTWQGLLAPAGTPEPILDRLHAEIRTAFARPEVSDNLTAQGFELASGSREEFTSLVRAEAARWPAIVKASGARVD